MPVSQHMTGVPRRTCKHICRVVEEIGLARARMESLAQQRLLANNWDATDRTAVDVTITQVFVERAAHGTRAFRADVEG